jgi:formylglycine-generating enzyme required for sulfatase activity
MRRFIANLQQFEPEIDAGQIADILWLAQHITSDRPVSPPAESQPVGADEEVIRTSTTTPTVSITVSGYTASISQSETIPSQPDTVPITSEAPSPDEQPTPALTAPPIRVAAARSLRKPIELERALRPLMRKVPSRSRRVLDEIATAEKSAETGIQMPVVRAEPQRWLDLALVIEETSLTEIWRKTINEFQWLLEHLGAFRDVRVWTMRRNQAGSLELLPRHSRSVTQRRRHHHRELIAPSGQRLILVISDCTSVSWWEGKIHDWLAEWATVNLVTLVQLLPQHLWRRGVLGEGLAVQLRTGIPGAPNSQWRVEGLPVWWTPEQRDALKVAVTVPVVTLEPTTLGQWARAVVGLGEVATAGVLFKEDWQPSSGPSVSGQVQTETDQQSAKQIVEQFRSNASPLARRLAVLMAATPVDVRVVELIQQTMVPESRQVHVAEVYLSGLLTRNQETGRFEFQPGVRAELRKSLGQSEAIALLNQVSAYLAERMGREIQSFAAFLLADVPEVTQQEETAIAFAEIGLDVLRQLGGQYASFAESLVQQRQAQRQFPAQQAEKASGSEPSDLPTLKLLEFESVQLVPDRSGDLPPGGIVLQTQDVEVVTIAVESTELQSFEFETATLEGGTKQSDILGNLFRRGEQRIEWVIRKQQRQAYQWVEQLGDEMTLEMVSIPTGSFIMGAPEDELKRQTSERPQHRVNISDFLMGKYPVTQAQWRFVANLPQIKRKLKRGPSRFKGDRRPVERVNWWDAVEFCDRLSVYSGCEYRLPSEAEWEYACRAGTTTPFHVGETITTDLANYRGTETYGQGPKGQYRQKTTDVESFPANAFGLHDMHGNVWEWCLDHWHGSYEGAPEDGSAWLSRDQNSFRVLRGGSWDDDPRGCRSATRFYIIPDGVDLSFGFRVVCVVPRTL